ncbi:sensor histidine kinase [Actinokineospora guangxiensis]|uniref:histidine kinase n=1 Tax=Actinokineospora guangxiensis TaxID=1490288 RepID=A0ABW0EL65_9PSEU
MRGMWGRVFDRTTYQRWVYLVLGGALSFPSVLFTFIVVPAVFPDIGSTAATVLIGLAFGLLVTVAATVLPSIRVLEGAAVRALLDDPVPGASYTATRHWPTRLRASAMFLLHVALGAVVSACTLMLPVVIVSGVAAPFTGAIGLAGDPIRVPLGWASAWIALVPVAALLVLVVMVRVAGGLLRRAAVVLLGVPMSERLAQLERKAERLEQRNRLARELHDSVGHALSVINLQAGAARMSLSAQVGEAPALEKSLRAIEGSCLAAMDDLDYVLGLLRDEPAEHNPQATLTQLPDLLETTRLAGAEVAAEVSGDPAALPATVSRQAYRIVQECLTNVLRHAGEVPVAVRLAVSDRRVELDVVNPVGPGAAERAARAGGGQGLRGMAERVDILGGRFSAGREGDEWRVAVSLSWDGTA